MNKTLWLITYENAHWCGGEKTVVVWAETADEAQYLAENHMEEEQRELFSDEYADEDEPEDSAVYINFVEAFNEKHSDWEYFKNPSQSSFYPVIGEP